MEYYLEIQVSKFCRRTVKLEKRQIRATEIVWSLRAKRKIKGIKCVELPGLPCLKQIIFHGYKFQGQRGYTGRICQYCSHWLSQQLILIYLSSLLN